VWASFNAPTLYITIAHHGACLLMEFGFCQPIEFDSVTYSICFGYDQTLLQMVGVNAIAISKQ
jgi:hypothetical protein